jgi:hypothetical protein
MAEAAALGAKLSQLSWTKARSSTVNGQCVEISSVADGRVAMRNSRDPDGLILIYTATEFRAFLKGARNGEFDHPAR